MTHYRSGCCSPLRLRHGGIDRHSGLIRADEVICHVVDQGMSAASTPCNASARPPSAVAMMRTFSSIMPIYEC
jgi:hypothetical protein